MKAECPGGRVSKVRAPVGFNPAEAPWLIFPVCLRPTLLFLQGHQSNWTRPTRKTSPCLNCLFTVTRSSPILRY